MMICKAKMRKAPEYSICRKGDDMSCSLQKSIQNIDISTIQFRGVYSAWSFEHNISYLDMLILHTISDEGYCTQKGIGDKYLFSRQTVHDALTRLHEKGYIKISQKFTNGRDPMLMAFVMTDKGQSYAAPLLSSLEEIEHKAANVLGSEKLDILSELLSEYTNALRDAVHDA